MYDVSIIDYNMGNLYSVLCACKYVGLNAIITDDHKIIENSKVIILPGVGAYGKAMQIIKKKKLDKTIIKHHHSKKNIIGICLGMQLLFEQSHEFSINKGLGIINGEVLKFNDRNRPLNVGWRKIIPKHINDSFLSKNTNKYYFIHSYYVKPKDENIVVANSYFEGFSFCCAIKYKNIQAFQFHPEKSGLSGLEIYRNLKNQISN